MSKQLLHTQQSNVAIVALNDRAFAIIKDENSSPSALVFELRASHSEASGNADIDVDATKAGVDGDGGGGNGGKGRGAGAKEQKRDKRKKQQRKRSPQEKINPLEIQAVCCTEVDSNIWLAVSREDKTLDLFSFSHSVAQRHDEMSANALDPAVTYNLAKRARCLAFGSISPPASTPWTGKHSHVILAGDLSGDVIAFPVPTSANPASHSEISTADDDITTCNVTPTTRRLLLGHTASMLTGLSVAPSIRDSDAKESLQQQPQQFILSADRDEKVRVSCFPETHIIHGYLLGHSSFVSAMDAVTTRSSKEMRPLCVTGSGDGTVRLWDYQLCQEVGMVPVVVIKQSDKEEKSTCDETLGKKKKSMAKEKHGQEEVDWLGEDLDDFSDQDSGHIICIPTSVALSPNAQHVIVARDGIPSINVHPIPPSPSKSSSTTSLLLSHMVSLHKKQTLECQSQPLAVRWFSDGSVLVLVRDHPYILHFQCRKEQEGDAPIEFNNATSSSPFSVAIHEVLKDQVIIMPSTLERNEEGEFKLQKNKVSDRGDNKSSNNSESASAGSKQAGGGLHWNDIGRKETAKLAEQRRRKRRKDEAKN